MKKTKLYTALLSLTFSFHAFAMGLGDMKVHSSLDMPFDAEITLIDVGGTPLSEIKVGLASEEDYLRAELEPTFTINDLTFVVERNHQGQPVIHIRSIDRVSEPFVQLLIDLAWAKGQVYREYSILLDPPDYQLSVGKKAHARVSDTAASRLGAGEKTSNVIRDNAFVEQEKQSPVIYGPTMSGETIWQIAQRYKSSGISLPQSILAIVGTNPDAFIDNNLNGLKVGSQLTIPSATIAGRVPVLDAKQEIAAHDLAWQTKQPIQHVVQPPYIEPPTALKEDVFESQVPSVSSMALGGHFIPPMHSYLSASQDVVPSLTTRPVNTGITSPAVNTQMDLASQAIETVRESNALLKEQLKSMQLQNKQLQKQLTQRDTEMTQMRSQIELLMRREGIGGQVVASSNKEKSSDLWLWVLVLLGMGAGGAYVAWRKWGLPESLLTQYFRKSKPHPDVESKPEEMVPTTSISAAIEKPAVFRENTTERLEPAATDKAQLETPIAAANTSTAAEISAEPIPVDNSSATQILPTPGDLSEESTNAIDKPIDVGAEVNGQQPLEEMSTQLNDDLGDHNLIEFNTEALTAPFPELDADAQSQSPETAIEEEGTLNLDLHIEDEGASIKLEDELEPADSIAITPSEPTVSGLSLESIDRVDKLQDEEPEMNAQQPLASSSDTNTEASSQEEARRPIRSSAALETLLTLAATYIEMGDHASATESLREVLEHGNETQQTAAKQLLKDLDERKKE